MRGFPFSPADLESEEKMKNPCTWNCLKCGWVTPRHPTSKSAYGPNCNKCGEKTGRSFNKVGFTDKEIDQIPLLFVYSSPPTSTEYWDNEDWFHYAVIAGHAPNWPNEPDPESEASHE